MQTVVQSEFVYAPEPEAVAELADIEWMVGVLRIEAARNHKLNGWVKAERLVEISAGTRSERKIRAIARAGAPEIFSYPGSRGYKLWKDCSMEELNLGLAAMEHQIRDMTVRRAIYERAFHSRFGGLR